MRVEQRACAVSSNWTEMMMTSHAPASERSGSEYCWRCDETRHSHCPVCHIDTNTHTLTLHSNKLVLLPIPTIPCPYTLKVVHICTGYSGCVRVYEKQPIFWLGLRLLTACIDGRLCIFKNIFICVLRNKRVYVSQAVIDEPICEAGIFVICWRS